MGLATGGLDGVDFIRKQQRTVVVAVPADGAAGAKPEQ
jgi:hypothetical protein